MNSVFAWFLGRREVFFIGFCLPGAIFFVVFSVDVFFEIVFIVVFLVDGREAVFFADGLTCFNGFEAVFFVVDFMAFFNISYPLALW
jgi:hypothetical protein